MAPSPSNKRSSPLFQEQASRALPYTVVHDEGAHNLWMIWPFCLLVLAMSFNPSIPVTMRAAQGKDYGDVDEMISVEEGIQVPRLSDLPEKKRMSSMIIQTLAVSLAPGDCRVLSGKTRELQGPPSFPYIPGGDCSGIVVELPPDANTPFKVGDRVAARFVEKPYGALGEYALVSTKVADKIPDTITAVDAAALVSATPATLLADYVQPNERVLVIGAGGPIGSHLCQVLRERGVAYCVGVGRDPDLILAQPIACDKAIDYTKEDVFDFEEFRNNKFDVIIDLAGFGYSKLELAVSKNLPLIVKTGSEGGRFITFVPPVGPVYEIRSIWKLFTVFALPILGKVISSRLWNRSTLPVYTFAFCLPETRDCVTRTLQLAQAGKLKAVIDGPFDFTTAGVRAAFRKQESRHAQGKVIIQVKEDKQ